jgi:hypothetical protein
MNFLNFFDQLTTINPLKQENSLNLLELPESLIEKIKEEIRYYFN